ncbi:helix-turn-helix domain-containing protein [uncultured Amnibacterium sp.]|uniref:helix-turn-helix domain-containing protein n=1 Tax=uncultured Amnibacterium sp. TaxID=1631851 RepID=UPI0035CA0EEC
MPTIELDDLVTMTEAEQLMGYDRRSLRRFVQDGRLPVAKKIPGHTGAYLFLRSDVEALRRETAA